MAFKSVYKFQRFLIGDKITPFEILFGIDFKNINTVNLDEIE